MLKRIITSLYYRFPFLTKRLAGKGFVFMMHRVLPKEEREKYDWNKTLAITPEALGKWIIHFKNKGYDLISMDEVVERFKQSSPKKFVALTLDDGYKDNLIYGLPVFEKYNIPFTLYLTNCYPNNNAVYWWYFLEDYIKTNSKIDLNSIGINFSREIKGDGKDVYDEARELLRKASYGTHKKFAEEICGIKNLYDLNISQNLTWEEVEQLHNHPLVTIGGHTAHHISLANHSHEDAKKDVFEGTLELKQRLKGEFKHFAPPYGSLDDISKQIYPIFTEAGYETAVINYPGGMFDYNDNSKFCIPRMGLADETSEDRLEELFNGKVHLNFNGLKREVL